MARKITESDLFDLPPQDLKLFFFLIARARFKDEPDGLKRGQCHVHYRDLQDALQYRSGYRWIRPTRDAVSKALRRLRGRDMVASTKATRGIVVTIINYDTYQTTTNYGGNGGGYVENTRGIHGSIQDREECKNGSMKEEVSATADTRSTTVDPDDDLPPVSLDFRKCPYSEIQTYWNSKPRLKANHPCQKIGAARKRSLRARWQDADFREHWQEVIDNCEVSDFLISDCQPFDFLWWIKNDRNWVKILEGKYANPTIEEVEVWTAPEK